MNMTAKAEKTILSIHLRFDQVQCRKISLEMHGHTNLPIHRLNPNRTDGSQCNQ
jgi:hypothetical protein